MDAAGTSVPADSPRDTMMMTMVTIRPNAHVCECCRVCVLTCADSERYMRQLKRTYYVSRVRPPFQDVVRVLALC